MRTPPRPRHLTLLPLVAATYFMVSGGPYGLEDLVQKAGYSAALVILVVTPLIWSLPVALLVGELSSSLPEEGGYYVWVRRAMGPFWGFMEAWLSLLASIFDMAIYPTLFVLYLGRLWPAAASGYRGLLVGAAVIALCTAWNLSGARAVGTGSVVLMLVLLAPFAAMVIVALLKPAAASGLRPTARPDLLGGIVIAMWNYMGWDNASTVAREVERPQRTYPLAMMAAVALVAVSYIVPVAAAARAGIDASAWSTGAWVEAGRTLGGPALALALVAGGMICGLGMFNSLVLSYSRVPVAMAEHGFLPAVFTRRRRKTGAPWVSIVVCAAAWTACLSLGFERLIELDVLLYGLSLALEFVALFMLRVREPRLARPFRVPGGRIGVLAVSAGPVAVIIAALIRGGSERAGPISALTLGLLLICAGMVLYVVTRFIRCRQGAPADAQPVETEVQKL